MLNKRCSFNEAYRFIKIFKNKILQSLDNIIGIYLFGSLTYGGFNNESSDIDLVVVTKESLNNTEIEIVKRIHEKLYEINEIWAKRLEVSYTPLEMFKDKNIPVIDRPYYNEIFYENAGYGNEWLINNYLLFKYGKTIYGMKFKRLLNYKIKIEDIKNACINDFYKEWFPKINNEEWLSKSNNQSYVILNICRIIYTINKSKLGNKQKSAKWVKKNYKKWKYLIEEAEKWDFSKIMNRPNETKEYIKYMEKEVNK